MIAAEENSGDLVHSDAHFRICSLSLDKMLAGLE